MILETRKYNNSMHVQIQVYSEIFSFLILFIILSKPRYIRITCFQLFTYIKVSSQFSYIYSIARPINQFLKPNNMISNEFSVEARRRCQIGITYIQQPTLIIIYNNIKLFLQCVCLDLIDDESLLFASPPQIKSCDNHDVLLKNMTCQL